MLDVAVPMILKMRADLAEAQKQYALDIKWFVEGKAVEGPGPGCMWIEQRLNSMKQHKQTMETLQNYLGMLDQEVACAQK